MASLPSTTLQWPPRAAEATLRLFTIDTTIDIAADRAAVHAFATNAARWHEWHPATRSVDGVPNRPLGTGETIVEHIRAGGRRFTATWVVLAAEAPSLWVIATDTPLGIARIAYRLEPADGGRATRFRRTLVCRSIPWPWRWLDPLMVRLVLAPQSRRALANLKRVVEGTAFAAAGQRDSQARP